MADLEELETMDASEIYSKRLNAKEVIFRKEEGEFLFPVADGRIKLPGRDQELRTSTLIREHPIRGEGGQEDGVPKAGFQPAADSRGSPTCVCANTLSSGWHTQERGEG